MRASNRHPKVHTELGTAPLYMDESFFRSLKFVDEFPERPRRKNDYLGPWMGEKSYYYFANCQEMLESLPSPEC